MRSAIFPQDFRSEPQFDNVDERMEWVVTQPRYSSVIIDAYRDLIYRIAIIRYDDDDYSRGKSMQLFSYPDNFSIIVCRRSGQYVGEFTFPSRIYHPYGMFVSEVGLNIPKSHPEYLITEGSEDEVIFDVFDLTGR